MSLAFLVNYATGKDNKLQMSILVIFPDTIMCQETIRVFFFASCMSTRVHLGMMFIFFSLIRMCE